MVSFYQKNITPVITIGEKIKKQRIDKGLTLNIIARKTKILENYLRAIEEGEWNTLPSEIYVKNFLHRYCDFLGLNFEQIFKEYEHERKVSHAVKKVKIEAFGKTQLRPFKRWYSFFTAKLLKNAVLILLVAAGLFFLGLKVNNIVAAPQLLIITPKDDNLVIRDSFFKIMGATDAGAKVSINGQSVIINPDGSFSERVDLQTGLNIIKISASKKYSKTIDVYREVMVER